MKEYNVTITRIEPTITTPHVSWIASVELKEPDDFSMGLAGHSFEAETPQLALASLAVYWAANGSQREADQ